MKAKESAIARLEESERQLLSPMKAEGSALASEVKLLTALRSTSNGGRSQCLGLWKRFNKAQESTEQQWNLVFERLHSMTEYQGELLMEKILKSPLLDAQ